MKVINKKAYHNYDVLESYTAGVVLKGSEVKSLRQNNVNFGDAYIIIKDGELFIKNMRISTYKEATINNHEEMREKKILLKKREINQISKMLNEKGVTLIPLEIFTLNNKFKVNVGVCRGKKNWDKRSTIKERDVKREVNRENIRF